MTTKPPLLIIFSLACILLTELSTAKSTLLITGHSAENIYKQAFAQQFVPGNELFREHSSARFLVLSSHGATKRPTEQNIAVQNFYDVHLSGNFTRVVLTYIGTDQMNMEDLEVLHGIIKSSRALVVVEIGRRTKQTSALLDHGAICWGEASANILSPNVAYLCNDLMLQAIESVVALDDLRGAGESSTSEVELAGVFWPGIFASAARAERKTRKIKVEEDDEEVHTTVQEESSTVVDEKSNDDQYRNMDASKKLYCKYRKSCYETGSRPAIDLSLPFSPFLSTQDAHLTSKDDDENQAEKEINQDEDITPLKLECKYRISCYKKRNIPLSYKDEEREERKRLLTNKRSFEQGKPKSLKSIAEKTVDRVKQAEEKAATRPIPSSVKAARYLNEIEEAVGKKLRCKYRKSCYETGKVPDIPAEQRFLWLTPSEAQPMAKTNVVYEQLDELDQKVYCKYRKSCYATGIAPQIHPDFSFDSILDIIVIPEVLESSRKISLQERCKYRKSCYETGVIPVLVPKETEEDLDEKITHVIPTNMQDLKLLCKYRKSCYEEVAKSDSVETVKNIRRRRLLERHLRMRQRKVKRARIRRHQRAILQDTDGIYRKSTRKERQAAEAAQIMKNIETAAENIEQQEDKLTDTRTTENAGEPTSTQSVTAAPSSKRKSKKTNAAVKTISALPVVTKEIKNDEEEKQPKSRKPQKKPQTHEEGSLDLHGTSAKPEDQTKRSTKRPRTIKQEETESIPVVEQNTVPRHKRTSKPKPIDVEDSEDDQLGTKDKASKRSSEKTSKAGKKSEQKVSQKTDDGVGDAVVPDISQTLPEDEQAKKDYCKYRKSCYKTGQKPIIDQTLSTLFGDLEHHVDHVYRENVEERSQHDHKLSCKYRKSCYETGRIPNIDEKIAMEEDHHTISFEHTILSKKLMCKYRRSCYEKNNFTFDEDEVMAIEKARKPEVVVDVAPAKQKGKPQEREDSKQTVDEEEERKTKVPATPVTKLEDIEVDQKLQCKYRRSCYSSHNPRSENQDHSSGNMARSGRTTELPITGRTKCNIYYLSCREKLGLPPKEKAPMGPNGRPLCRKKKQDI